MIERLLELQRDGGRAVLFTVIEGEGVGSKLLVVEGGETAGDGPAELAEHADELIRGARNRTLELEGRKVFAEVYGPPPRLLVYGAVDTAEALSAAAKLLGWRTIVADARPKFATRERIPSADELIVAWPEETFAQVQPDHATAIVVLTHDDKFDLPALELALASDAFYIGADRRPAQPGEEARAAARSRARRGDAGADRGPVRPRPRRRLGPGDGALDPRRGAGGAERARRRPAQRDEAADPRRGVVVPRTAVVTGAARGLGEAIARRLAADGDRVLLADLNLDGARTVAAEVGGEAVEHDVRSIESWERLLQTAGDVDVLVNNAARTEIRSFWEIDVDEWDDVLATNLRGTYLGCRVVGAQMRERGSGRIVNLASVAGQNSRAVTGVHYATSKAAIIALTRHAATELAGSGVTVNAVAPAAIDGPMVATVAPERLEAMLKTIPVGRLGQPDEVAAAVAYLASDAAGFVTGATLDVNGGMLMR